MYNPGALLDHVSEINRCKSDAQLAKLLCVAPPVISKIRHRRLPVGSSMLIRIHETTGLSIKEIRVLMGDRRAKYRMSAGTFKQDAA